MTAFVRRAAMVVVHGAIGLLVYGFFIAGLNAVVAGPTAPALAAAEKPAPPEVKFSGGLLSLTAKDADIRMLIETIAAKSGVEIILDKIITGRVTVEFKDVKFEEGLKIVLKDVVEGGFAYEYVRKTGAREAGDLQKVFIARQGVLPKPLGNIPENDILRINEMWVGDAKGEEVLFVPWGDGEGQIPIKVVVADGKEWRLGFDRFRVGEDGFFYFVGWGHKKLWVYSSEGKPMKAIDLTLPEFGADTFDVDHEGNVYVLTKQGRKDDAIIDDIRVYNRDAKEVARVSASAGLVGGGPCAVAVDGRLVNLCESGRVVADFRYLLRDPNNHSRKFKDYQYKTMPSLSISNPLGPVTRGIGTLLVENVKRLGIPHHLIAAPLPEEWALSGNRLEPLGYQKPNYYWLVPIPAERRFHADYAIGVLDLANKCASYYRIAEKDTFIFETRELLSNEDNFDIDLKGNVYQFLTRKDGVHIYRYGLEAMQ